MSKKNIINDNNKLYSSCEFLSTDSRKCKKKESLFSQKTTLQKILSQIKYCLIDSLSNKSEKNKNMITKDILSTFKDNLNLMLEEKNKLYQRFQKEKLKKFRKKSDTIKKPSKFTEIEKTNDLEDNKISGLNSDLGQLFN